MRSSHLALLNCKGARSEEHQGACGQFGEHYYIYHTEHLQLGDLDAYGESPGEEFSIYLSSFNLGEAKVKGVFFLLLILTGDIFSFLLLLFVCF